AIMQGQQAVASITDALDQIYQNESSYDGVVLVRGGGSQTDLGVFDDYSLASHMAQFPLPILTGIGHEKDESVADMVAYRSLKTPTAVAEFLVDAYITLEQHTTDLADQIIHSIKYHLKSVISAALVACGNCEFLRRPYADQRIKDADDDQSDKDDGQPKPILVRSFPIVANFSP
ncbi:MAG: exodeoxyribonuclease VII large subunit, partial [Candidatus Promineifilaceae bacterium]